MTDWSFLPDPASTLAAYAQAKATYEAKHQNSNYDTAILGIAHRIIQAEPYAYLQLGVYWWSVKRILKAHGHFIAGEVESPALMLAYNLPESEAATVYAAFAFRDWFIDNCFLYAREHVLNAATEETYVLVDEAHEASFAVRG